MRAFQSLALTLGVVAAAGVSTAQADPIRGHYVEARTCQVYTGPCFANGEVGQTGKDAVMAWHILSGGHNDVDLAGLNVVVVVQASNTLGFTGIEGVDAARSMVLLDAAASTLQQEALLAFAKQQIGKAGEHVARVSTTPIEMRLNTATLEAHLTAGRHVELVTRKARPGDCICSNEAAYYPPLAKVEHCAPGVTIEGQITARPLGIRWAIPDTRTAYMATFAQR